MSARRPRAQLVPRRRLRCRGRRRAPIVGIGAAAAHCQIEAVRAEGSRPSQNALAPRATLRAPNTRCIGTGLRAARAATRSAARAHCTAGRSGHRFQNGREALRKVIRERSARECRHILQVGSSHRLQGRRLRRCWRWRGLGQCWRRQWTVWTWCWRDRRSRRGRRTRRLPPWRRLQSCPRLQRLQKAQQRVDPQPPSRASTTK
mmetsp:Transcript_22361/g.66013  ORF Transcript_22361/g.66013 Transcript_22361/m.66013 type:complete len:204 (+) Transcript_22361:720-1331(+)